MSQENPEAERAQRAVDTIRFLAVDAVERAASGHPGMPMGMADAAFTLWTRFLRHDPTDPDWVDRDRFVLSAGHGSMLIYALLHLSGYELTIDDIKSFRQWESATPGHPERGDTPGVEVTTGPLGQGLGNAVGMALAAHRLAETFNGQGFDPVGQRVFGIVSDGDLMEGVASEAASIAGHLRLGRMTLLYDDNSITIEGETELTFAEDVGGRFEAYGWHVLHVDGHDREAVAEAIQAGIDETGRPSLICCRTRIAYGSPGKEGTAASHGSPLGEEEVEATKRARVWPSEPTFHVPDEVRELFAERAEALARERKAWNKGYEGWRKKNAALAGFWDALHERRVADDVLERLIEAAPRDAGATRALGGKVLQAAAAAAPALIGGSADLGPSTNTEILEADWIGPGAHAGRNLHFGIREHGMGALMNGLAAHGSALPFGATFLVFADYMRPSIRLAALMKLQAVYVFTHDSIFVGEDGPTHQPIEQIASLRIIPNLHVVRPADGLECAAAWAHALSRRDGPTALVLSRQKLTPLPHPEGFETEKLLAGGYVLKERSDAEATIVGTGSEASLALDASVLLERDGRRLRLVSMPCLDAFWELPEEEREAIVPSDLPVAVVEAGVPDPWYRLAGRDGLVLGLERFGASAPAPVLAEKLGFTAETVARRIEGWLPEATD
jgi:transketolase